ncbi:hypothetical protein KIN20_034351 [Parelaphostrongylus tenuis]|uniref:BZIP domain-containing protein n=1 Tax=Parelaphostrongylus tenuis TaxID=148309 RepID=A0AAD5WJZ5_PARTN|nr:hypothetical protein KIN20_034351 [Parelaphostrongylus tenuis]
MSSIVTSNGHAIANSSLAKDKKVQILASEASPNNDLLETPNPQRLLGLGGTTPLADFPLTAELMQKCMTVNPFEAKFREANRKLTTGTLEANGLVPATISLSNTNAFSLLKLPSSLSDSPGIFSNISILQTDADGMMSENLKTADISKLLLQMKDTNSSSMDGSSTQQAPRTADVLNAVLDMHSDRLHTINYINKPDFSMFSSLTPSGSAPNSAGVLAAAAAAQCTPSTSGGLLVPPSRSVTISPTHSPRSKDQLVPEKRSSASSDVVNPVTAQSHLLSALHSAATVVAAASGADPASWDPRDVKPAVSKHNTPGYFEQEEALMPSSNCSGLPQTVADTSSSHLLSLDDRTPVKGGADPQPPGRGRGRGRASFVSDMLPDERKMTILERNKAAAVRYRKRKKEEHDDMISRVHTLEQEKVQLNTQNQVLRRELERVTALLREREARCICLKGMPLSSELRAESPADVDLLPGSQHTNMYIPQTQQLINGLGLPNGMGLKRPKI